LAHSRTAEQTGRAVACSTSQNALAELLPPGAAGDFALGPRRGKRSAGGRRASAGPNTQAMRQGARRAISGRAGGARRGRGSRPRRTAARTLSVDLPDRRLTLSRGGRRAWQATWAGWSEGESRPTRPRRKLRRDVVQEPHAGTPRYALAGPGGAAGPRRAKRSARRRSFKRPAAAGAGCC